MKSKLLSTVLFWVIIFFSVGANAAENRDGNWWLSQSSALQVSWTIGYLDGMVASDNYISSILSLGTMYRGMPNCDNAACYGSPLEYGRSLQNDINQRESEYKNITAGQIADDLSTLFSDYRNRQINIIDATELVTGSIRGWTNEQIQKRLEYLRRSVR